MRGVSEVIAIILILMITIAIAGLAYMFMSTTMSDVTSSAGSTVDTTTSSMSTSFTIESISQGKVYVRNTGQGALTGLSVYVSDQAVNASVPASIASRAVGTINVTSIIFEGDSIRVTSSNGVSASKRAPAEWYGAVGYWKFDEGSGLYAYDSSPYGNRGTLVSMESNDWVDGKHGKALLFDGTLEYVEISDAAQYANSDQISISMWVNVLSQDQEWEDFFSKEGDRIETATVGSKGMWWFGTSTNNIFNFNEWNHITLISSYSQNKTWFYFNGIQVSNSPNSYTSLPFNAGPIKIGGLNGQIFNGIIDDVALWNRSLAPQEILKLYNK